MWPFKRKNKTETSMVPPGEVSHTEAGTERSFGDLDASVLETALGEGDPQKVRRLIEAGADIHYVRKHGYTALIDAVHGRDVFRDARLLDLLRLLIDRGVNLSATTSYAESGLRVLSRIGRFDGVGLLLASGADRTQLEWTPLMEAVAIGTLTDVQTVLDTGPDLEARDWWSRTAWLIALMTGDIAKTQLLRDHGADTQALGKCGQPPLFYAIQSHHPQMLQWLLQHGADIHETSEHGGTALMEAVNHDDEECVKLLLDAGADVAADSGTGTALRSARSRPIIMQLLEAGADPAHASQRAMLGMSHSDIDDGGDEAALDAVTPAQFRAGALRVFGTRNPERMDVPFWHAMIRAGVSAYTARMRFEGPDPDRSEPVWCARRFGQSLTLLPDGRAIQIAGEHEDHYDPDFCIYNDVFVHGPDGSIAIYGYPEDVFPPTDFHTATLIGDHIHIIGSLGYPAARRFGQTPVFRVNVHTLRIEPLMTQGEAPGWIFKHRAAVVGADAIRVWGGHLAFLSGDQEQHERNDGVFVLDLKTLHWRRA